MPKPPNIETNVSELISLIKNNPLFKFLSDFKMFQLANSIHIEKYKPGAVILKDGLNSAKFYIIKIGTVHITISKVAVKTLEKNHTFGDISSQIGEYSRKADFVASGRVECYIIDKELNKNPNKRICAFNAIKSLPFFEGFDFEALLNMKISPPYKPEGKLKEKDLENVDIPFTHFMRNNIYSSSNELDELLKKNADDFLSGIFIFS